MAFVYSTQIILFGFFGINNRKNAFDRTYVIIYCKPNAYMAFGGKCASLFHRVHTIRVVDTQWHNSVRPFGIVAITVVLFS